MHLVIRSTWLHSYPVGLYIIKDFIWTVVYIRMCQGMTKIKQPVGLWKTQINLINVKKYNASL